MAVVSGRPRHPLRADAERLLRAGHSAKEIASRLGLHRTAVAKWKSELVRSRRLIRTEELDPTPKESA